MTLGADNGKKVIMKLFVFAGELSADMHAGHLLTALKKQKHNLSVSGVVGPAMRQHNIKAILQMEDFEVMGFSDVLAALPRLWKQYKHIRDHILTENPDITVFIDSPSLSLRMAHTLRKKGYSGKIVQYISPTVWAWGQKRIQKMAQSLDLLLTIYPFETEYFAATSLPVEYVGNPLIETLHKHHYDPQWHKLFGIKQGQQLLGLFPGSRAAEIQRNLPIQLQTAKLLLQQQPQLALGISCAQSRFIPLMRELLQKYSIACDVFFIPKEYSYDFMRFCRGSIAKSGTVTLELALHHCPTVVMYQLTWLNRLMAKYVMRLKLPHYCIVNILGKKSIFPEFIAESYLPQDIIRNLAPLIAPGQLREDCLEDCRKIKALFSNTNVSERAASAILKLKQ